MKDHHKSSTKRELIKTHVYKIGNELSPVWLFRITTMDIKRYEKEGWEEVLISTKQYEDKIAIRYTGVKKEKYNATQNCDSETEKAKDINPFIEAVRQAFSFFC